MKLLILFSFALFALTSAGPPPPQEAIHIPEKCDDVLSVKVCEKLNNMAAKLKLKSEEVTKAVLEAYKQGKTKSEEIYKQAKDFLVNKVMTKKCEDLTSAENCNKLRKLAADLKVKADKVAEFIVKQIAELKTKECEDLLTADQCTKLRDVASKLKIKFGKLQDMIVDAYIEAKTNGKQMIVETYNKVKAYVMATRCEDMFNPGLCSAFRKYAEKTKVALPKIMETAYNLVLKGVDIGKDLVKKVFDLMDYFWDCTDIFDQSSCDRLSRWATKLKISFEKFQVALRKYVRIAIEKGTSIYKSIKDFVKNKIYCRFTKSCVNSEDVNEVEDDVAFGIFGDYKEKMREILNNKFPNLEANMRATINKMIDEARSKWELMYMFAQQIKSGISQKWAEFLKKFMTESYLY